MPDDTIEAIDLEDTTTETPSEADDEANAQIEHNEDDEAQPRNREERFRKEARALKTQLDIEQAHRDLRDRADVERIVTGTLANPSEIWRDGTDVAAFIGDDGLPSKEAVLARAQELLAAHAYLAAPKPQRTPPASIVTGEPFAPVSKTPAFEKAFSPADPT